MFWLKPKIQYTDILQEYRDIHVDWEFNGMDKILYRLRLAREEEGNPWKKAIILSVFAKEEDGKKWYKILEKKDGQIVDKTICVLDQSEYCYEVKKDYWEFQKEFESIEKAKKKMQDVERLSRELAEAREAAEKLYQEWNKIVTENTLNHFWQKWRLDELSKMENLNFQMTKSKNTPGI